MKQLGELLDWRREYFDWGIRLHGKNGNYIDLPWIRDDFDTTAVGKYWSGQNEKMLIFTPTVNSLVSSSPLPQSRCSLCPPIILPFFQSLSNNLAEIP
ncbi:MAG: hypothetical protein NC189_07755 [Bacteroides sp.]|nr:hypothetical protein [Bacteroides sp.]